VQKQQQQPSSWTGRTAASSSFENQDMSALADDSMLTSLILPQQLNDDIADIDMDLGACASDEAWDSPFASTSDDSSSGSSDGEAVGQVSFGSDDSGSSSGGSSSSSSRAEWKEWQEW
jgi:hypothetical protein